MRGVFILSLLLLAIYEFAATWLVMPLLGSQELDSVQLAWFLNHYRWGIRFLFAVLILFSLRGAFVGRRKWIPVVFILITGSIVYTSNFILTAEALFQPPSTVRFASPDSCGITNDAIVIGVIHGSEAKAYPIRYIAYHHQVYDTIDALPILVTYCSVCRSGRVYDTRSVDFPAGHLRLVGMTQFNAMFEDPSGSWWMQASGESVAGPRKGERMLEIASVQMSISKMQSLYPNVKVMCPDPASSDKYDVEGRFEKGLSKGSLTKPDRDSWKPKSWVVGVTLNGHSRAYDWNELLNKKVINDTLAASPIVLTISSDQKSFAAFERPGANLFTISNDTLIYNEVLYLFSGNAVTEGIPSLKKVNSFQEHWHSWQQFRGSNKFDREN